MAYLSIPQIQEILQNGSNSPEELRSCRKHDIRAKFHVEPSLDVGRSPYYSEFIAWVSTIINQEKLAVFQQVMTLPVETVEFTKGVFDELTKIFEASDRFIGYEFTNPELSKDFADYLKDRGDNTFWQTKGFATMKSDINTIVILDLPAVQDMTKDRFPRPYYYFLDVQKVKAFAMDTRKFKFEFIVFCNRYDSTLIHVFDDGFYRTFKEESAAKEGQAGTYTLLSEVPHDLGYTPARSFWTTPFEQSSKLQKRGPQTNSLGNFDWLLMLYTFTRHAELYSGFPIDVMYEQQCSYTDASGNRCENGQIRKVIHLNMAGTETKTIYEDCPTCKNKRLLGPGTVLTAPGMASKDDPDMIQGMNRIGADKDSLEYLLNRIDNFQGKISTNMIGYIAEFIREAMNKEQVDSMLESRKAALSEVRDNFQNIHLWCLEGMAKLRYGSPAVVSVTCNYGSRWFLQTVGALQAQYKESKANGFTNFELSAQFEQILQTKYKNNPAMMEKVRTLAAIEPYQGYTVSDLGTLTEKFGLNIDLVRLKIDFAIYVQKFEMEFTDIGAFMQFAPFAAKVAFIQEKLLEYVKDDYEEQDAQEETVRQEELEAKKPTLMLPPGAPAPAPAPGIPANA